MKKNILLIASLLVLTLGAVASPVDIAKARKAATNFWNTYRPSEVKAVESLTLSDISEYPNLYIFRDGNQGFVLMSADDRIRPVLAYSFVTPFPAAKELHTSLRHWLGDYNDQIAFAVANNLSDKADAAAKWHSLLNDPVPASPKSLRKSAAMLKSTWDQGIPYNKYCPLDTASGANTVVGCVATAMAQTMRYWQHPACGTGSHSYYNYSSGETLTADFEHTTYPWSIMPDYVHTGFAEYKINAVATISYHCGVAVNMNYGPSSGAQVIYGSNSALNALKYYFKYNAETIRGYYRSQFNDSAWMAMIDTEMAARRPIIYAGFDSLNTGGHAFVLDGADSERRYHFNWGWSGNGDGFFTIDRLTPGSSGAGSNNGHNYSFSQSAIFGIQPVYEHFDTVEVYDSVCTDAGVRYYYYNEYRFEMGNLDTVVQHLDTVVRLHVRLVGKRFFDTDPNGGVGERTNTVFCLADGALMPECTYTKTNCRFIGWCLDPDGERTLYQPGEVVRIQRSCTFYAIWKDTTVGITPLDTESAPLLYPNPTADVLHIRTASPATQITVIDAQGRTLLRVDHPKTTDGKTVEIPLQTLPAGAYTVQINTTKGKYNQRIIKQKKK